MLNSLVNTNLTFVSNAGDKYFIVLIMGLASAGYLFAIGNKKESLLLLVSLMSTGFSWCLKMLFRQQRPIGADPHFIFDTYSFPSSHTLTYTAFFGMLIYLAFKLTGIPLPFRLVAVLISAYFIILVGISRVYLGQHYIWDVAAGYIFGFLYLVGLILLDKRL